MRVRDRAPLQREPQAPKFCTCSPGRRTKAPGKIVRVALPSGGSPRWTDGQGAQRAKFPADFLALARDCRTQKAGARTVENSGKKRFEKLRRNAKAGQRNAGAHNADISGFANKLQKPGRQAAAATALRLSAHCRPSGWNISLCSAGRIIAHGQLSYNELIIRV